MVSGFDLLSVCFFLVNKNFYSELKKKQVRGKKTTHKGGLRTSLENTNDALIK